MAQKVRNNRKKELTGVVIETKMQKTVKVEVSSPIRHPVYHKVVSNRRVFKAHTEKDLKVGDKVVICESKPSAKTVRWNVLRVIEE